MLLDVLGVFSTAAIEKAGGWDATAIEAGSITAVVDAGFGTKGNGNKGGTPLAIRFGVGNGTPLASGTSIAFTVTSGTTSAGTGTTSDVFTLTLAQMNAGYTYMVPQNAARYLKVVGAASTGTFDGDGRLKIYLTAADMIQAGY
jgi:hypothetical protein